MRGGVFAQTNQERTKRNEKNLLKGNPNTQFRSGREAVENGKKGGKIINRQYN